MASNKYGLIIVPKPGQLLTELGATGTLADAAKEVMRDYAQTKLRGEVLGESVMGIDWGAPDEGVTYKEKTFKNQYFGFWPPEKPKVYDGEAVAGGITKQSLTDGVSKVGGINWSDQAEVDAIAMLDQQIAISDLARFPDIFGPPQQTLQQGPEDTPIEPDASFRRAKPRVRPVDTGEPET